MIVATMLVGAAVWNYSPGSWDNREIAVVSFAASHLGKELDKGASPGEIALFARAKDYIALLGYPWQKDKQTEGLLRDQSLTLQRTSEDNYSHIKAPIIGIAFNANDMGLIGGFGLLAILFVLRFAIMREKANLAITFRLAARRGCVNRTYRLLSMSQVLTVPPGIVAHQRFWNAVHKGLFVFPTVVFSYVVLVDLMTMRLGWVISPSNAFIEVGARV